MNKKILPDLWNQNCRQTFRTGADEKMLFFQNTDSRFRYQCYNSYYRRRYFRFREKFSQNFATRRRKTLTGFFQKVDSRFLMNKEIVPPQLYLQVANLGIDSI